MPLLQHLIQHYKIKRAQGIDAYNGRTLLQEQKRDLGETLAWGRGQGCAQRGVRGVGGSLDPAAGARAWERCKEQENHPIATLLQPEQQSLGLPMSSLFPCILRGLSLLPGKRNLGKGTIRARVGITHPRLAAGFQQTFLS